MSNIHNYPVESLTFNDDDFYDIDYFNGVAYETRKIKGSTIKAGILASGLNQIQLNDVTGDLPPYQEGLIFYANGVFNAYIDEADITLQIGQEFWVKVRNNTGVTIPDGKVVYITGAIGQNPTIELADASSFSTAYTLGVTTHSIENNTNGYVTTIGRVNGIDMSAFSDGDEVYLSETTAGELTNIKPISPNSVVTVGTVLNSVANGSLLVKVTEPVSINDLTEVNTATLSDGQMLQYDGTAGRWENGTLYNLASSQWGRTLPAPQLLPNNAIANGMTFFDNVADKDSAGTTSWNEWNITFGIEIELTAGTTGTAQINVNGVNYPLNFTVDRDTSAQNWVTTNAPLLAGVSLVYFIPAEPDWLGQGPKDARIRFCTTEATANGITFTPDVGSDWVGVISNPFTGTTNSAGDHIIVPYVGEPYEGQRLHHQFRVNFEFDTVGGTGILALSLRRFANDTQIGSDIQVNKNNDVGGVLETFITYTASASDSFVQGGFYFLLTNLSGGSVNFINKVGMLLQTSYQQPVKY